MTTPTPQPGFAPAPVNSTQWNAQVVQAAAEAQKQAITDRTQTPLGSPMDWLLKPVEWLGSKMHAAYSAAVSRPLSTLFLASYIGSAEANSQGESWSNLFDKDIWDRAYKDAAHVSPGQAFEFGLENFFGDMRTEMKKPVIYKPVDQSGKQVIGPDGKPVEINLNKDGYIWDNPDAVKVHFDSGIQKYISGGLDAYFSWYADPTVKASQGLGVARNLAYVRPAVSAAEKPRLGTILAEKAGIISTDTSRSNVAKNVNSNAFTAMGDNIMKNKEKLGEDGFGEWITRQNWAKNSSDSGALSNALANAKDRDEVNKILAVSIGDVNAAQALEAKSATLAAQMNMLERQKQGLITGNPVNVTGEQAQKLQLQLSLLSDDMTKIDAQQANIGRVLKTQNTMKNGMYFNPVLSPIASDFGQYARGLTTKSTEGGNALTRTFGAGMNLVYNNLYVRPVRVLSGTTWNAVRAPGHIDIDAADSHLAFGASLDQAKVWTPDQVRSYVSQYVGADRATKDFIVQQADLDTVRAIGAKYGLTDNQADKIYRELGGLKGAARDGRVYSTAYINTAEGGRLRADHVADDGSLVAVSPVLNSQLQNTHILTDYEHMDRVLKLTAAPFQKLLRENDIQEEALAKLPGTLGGRALQGLTVGSEMGDIMQRLWKFNVLFRVGYGPRAIADDFLGQVARLGASNLFFDRMLVGGRNMFNRNLNKALNDPTGYETVKAGIDTGLSQLGEDIAFYQRKVSQPFMGTSLKNKRKYDQKIAQHQANLDDAMEQQAALREYSNKIGQAKNSLGDNYVITPDGMAFARPFEGAQGQLFKNLVSGRQTLDSIMGGTATSRWNQFRQGDWQVVTAQSDRYVGAYSKVLAGQIANDKAAQAVFRGEDLTQWFKTGEGRAYRSAAAMKNMTEVEHAERITETVNHILPVGTPEQLRLRQLVADGASDNDIAKAVREATEKHAGTGMMPDVQAEGIAYGMGKSDINRIVDGSIEKFYKVANQMPSEVLSRNPLFFQLYRQHVGDLWQSAKEQGVEKLTPMRQQNIEESARKLALKDVKKLTFNMDHETKLAHAMRFISPFFGPTQESFNRWGRIIADKPDVVAKAANIYTSPIRAGHTVDQNGNLIDENGYVTNPDGSKTLVSKQDMHIQFQAPQWLAKAIGMDQGSIVDMPINTLNLTLQNDPWYNPGTGPWVQLPANWVALRSDPKVGDTMTRLGILQQVTPDMKSQITGAGPKLLDTIIGSPDPEAEQRDMAYIMQAEDYKYKTGMRSTQPTWQEVKDRVETNAYLKAWMKFTLPVSTSFKDPYQFFRDRYQELVQADQKTADQVFLAKYGDAAFAFTGAMSFNRKKLPATREAVLADQKYKALTDENPDLAALIVGPEAMNGTFSKTAYVQQMMSGDRKNLNAMDVMNKAEENQGWAEYNKHMNIISAKLRQAGFNSFQDQGAEAYDQMRKNMIGALTQPMVNGKPNQFYNEQFSKVFLTIDRGKDERNANAFRQIVTEAQLINDPMRQDIQGLSKYMIYRDSVNRVLQARDKAGGSADINANANRDLKLQFSNAVNQLTEQNTQFESLHNRWLTHDMFDHHNPYGSN